MEEGIKKQEIKLELKKGEKYSFCTCGKGRNLPFCDNSHRKLNEEKATCFKSFKIKTNNDTEAEIYCSNWFED